VSELWVRRVVNNNNNSNKPICNAPGASVTDPDEDATGAVKRQSEIGNPVRG